jgi:cytochrome c oxidase cbb3-type subunit III
MAVKQDIDDVTGVETTGHEWDGIKELNKPLPKWWLYVLYATIVWSLGYWVLYPAWPWVSGYTRGVFGYSERQQVAESVQAAKASQAGMADALAKASLAEIKADPKLLEFALAGGRTAFGDNCAPCHGRGAQGAEGYPNLNDDDWIWGGGIEAIHQTIAHGIRNGTADARDSAMPRFGLDGALTPAQIADTAEYVLALSAKSTNEAAAGRGKAIFADNCVACHGENGKGNPELGAPNLADAIWLYSSSKADIVKSIETGRGGVMPAWTGRLDATTVKKLAAYVHSLGGGQ